MGRVSTTAAPDQGFDKSRPLLPATDGDQLELLILAPHTEHAAGVDLRSGALLRAWFGAPSAHRLRPYDLVRATLSGDLDAAPDPSEPEAVVLSGAPERIGRLTGRRAEKLLRPLLHPDDTPLLGSHAPALPFWARRADQPSVTLVQPQGPILLRREPAYLACRFAWSGTVREFPCLDRRVAGDMDRMGQRQRVVDKGTRLVIAFTPPIEGHCHKVVESILPRL
jgi:hypothetical protein